jgi:hypothetical protein
LLRLQLYIHKNDAAHFGFDSALLVLTMIKVSVTETKLQTAASISLLELEPHKNFAAPQRCLKFNLT